MGVGDNFDTSTKGLTNRKTGRIAGSFESGRVEQDNNFGHPCNIGCGCKKVCDGLLGPCLIPPELTVTLTKSDKSRLEAEFNVTQGSQGKGNAETFHLIYSNGVWRGRKCCFDADSRIVLSKNDDGDDEFHYPEEGEDESLAGASLYFVRDENAAKSYGKHDENWESKHKLSGFFKFDSDDKPVTAVGCVDSEVMAHQLDLEQATKLRV